MTTVVPLLEEVGKKYLEVGKKILFIRHIKE